MIRRVVLVTIAAALFAPVILHAHHSFPAFYLEDQSVSIEGELVEFEYRAPHAWVHVRAKDSDGTLRTFAAEWANPNRLGRDQVTKETLKPGDHVIITGSPSRKPEERKLHLKKIERPADGWTWIGRGGPPPGFGRRR